MHSEKRREDLLPKNSESSFIHKESLLAYRPVLSVNSLFFSSLPDSCGFSREEERETDKVELEEEEELCIRAEQHWPVLHSLGDSSQLRWEH